MSHAVNLISSRAQEREETVDQETTDKETTFDSHFVPSLPAVQPWATSSQLLLLIHHLMTRSSMTLKKERS